MGIIWNSGLVTIPPFTGVLSFNTRTGAVTLLSSDVTGALGYTPLDPALYPVNLGGETLQSVLTRGSLANFAGITFDYDKTTGILTLRNSLNAFALIARGRVNAAGINQIAGLQAVNDVGANNRTAGMVTRFGNLTQNSGAFGSVSVNNVNGGADSFIAYNVNGVLVTGLRLYTSGQIQLGNTQRLSAAVNIGATVRAIAASGLGFGQNINPTLYPSANNDHLIGQNIQPIVSVSGGALTLNNLVPGGGYTGNTTFNNVPALGGTGNGLTLNITLTLGVITACTINVPGGGYTVNDLITVDPSFDGTGLGSGFSINIATLTSYTGVVTEHQRYTYDNSNYVSYSVAADGTMTVTPVGTAPGIIWALVGSATGDIWYRAANGKFTRLGIGTNGQQLIVSGGLPAWQTLAAGGVISFNTRIGAITLLSSDVIGALGYTPPRLSGSQNTFTNINDFEELVLAGGFNAGAGFNPAIIAATRTSTGITGIGWNYGGSLGETDFFNFQGPGSNGGYNFYTTSNAGVTRLMASLNGATLDLNVAGRLAAGIYDAYPSPATKYLTADPATGAIVTRTTTEVVSDLGLQTGGVPTITMGPNAGAGAVGSLFSTSNSQSGRIDFTTGTGPVAGGAIFIITLNGRPFNLSTRPIVQETGIPAFYVTDSVLQASSLSPYEFTVGVFKNALAPLTSYSLYYQVELN